MKKKKRRGISAGTVLMILIAVVVLGVSFRLVAMIAGQTTLKIDDAQNIVSAIAKNLDLPELKLSDIPIFQSAAKEETEATSPAPTFGELATTGAAAPVQTVLEPTPTPVPQKKSFTLTAAGSFLINKDIRNACYYKESETYDFSALLTHISDAVWGDLKVFTLENLIAQDQKLSNLNTRQEILDAVKEAGFDLAFIGQDKSMDLGLAGLTKTINALKSQGFSVVGGYESGADAEQTLIMNINGIQVALLHYTQSLDSANKAKKEKAEYAVPLIKIENIQKDIVGARSQGAQVVIVSCHWGSDNTHTVSKTQAAFAQQIADAGADVILGAHSHAVQPIVYLTGNRADGTARQTLVAYSLGALMTGSRESVNIASLLLHLNITFDPLTSLVSFDEVSYSPVYFWRHKEEGRYVYDAVLSNHEPPENMAKDQVQVMEKALNRVTDVLKDSVAVQR